MANIFKKIQKATKDTVKTFADPLNLGYGDAIFGGGSQPNAPDLSGTDANQQAIIAKILASQPSQFYEYNPATVDSTAYDNISVDPQYRDAQLSALNKLKEISDGGGMTLEDTANLSKFSRSNAQADRSRVADIERSMAETGNAGSGASLALQLASADNAADRESEASQSTAATAQRRALDAIAQRGQQAGSMRSQEFGEQEAKASAADRLAQFNTQTLNAGRQYNAQGQQAFDQSKFDNTMSAQGLSYNNESDKANRATSNYNSDLDRKQAEKDRWFNIGGKALGAATKGG